MSKFRRSLAAVMCLVVGLGSFALSYVALQEVSIRESAVPAGLAWLVPIVIDGGVICGSAVIWSLSREQQRRPVFPFLFVAALVIISVVVNMSHAGPSLLAKGIAALPPLVLLCTLELVAAQGRRDTSSAPAIDAAADEMEAPASVPVPVSFLPVSFTASSTAPSSYVPDMTHFALKATPTAEIVPAAPAVSVEAAPLEPAAPVMADAQEPTVSAAPAAEVPADVVADVEELAVLTTPAGEAPAALTTGQETVVADLIPVQGSSTEDGEVLAEVVPLRRTSAAARTRTTDTVKAPVKRAAKTTKAAPAKPRTSRVRSEVDGLEDATPRTRTRKVAAEKKAAPARKAPRIQATPPSDES